MEPGAEPIYDTVAVGPDEIKIENNIACEREVEEGDVDRAFAEADVVVEGTFQDAQDLPRADGAQVGGLPARAGWRSHRLAHHPVDPQRAHSAGRDLSISH